MPSDSAWAKGFYARQAAWMEEDLGSVEDWHRERIATIERVAGPGPWRILELGAGAGQTTAAAIERGHRCVAIELVPELARRARGLTGDRGAGRAGLRPFREWSWDECLLKSGLKWLRAVPSIRATGLARPCDDTTALPDAPARPQPGRSTSSDPAQASYQQIGDT